MITQRPLEPLHKRMMNFLTVFWQELLIAKTEKFLLTGGGVYLFITGVDWGGVLTVAPIIITLSSAIYKHYREQKREDKIADENQQREFDILVFQVIEELIEHGAIDPTADFETKRLAAIGYLTKNKALKNMK